MKKKVLFICEENACRSQIAEALMRIKYSDKFVAFSAGTNESNAVNPVAIEIIKDMFGYDMIEEGQHTKNADDIMLEFDVLVNIGNSDFSIKKPQYYEEWDLVEIEEPTYEVLKDIILNIESKIDNLVTNIEKSPVLR